MVDHTEGPVQIPAGGVSLKGDLALPAGATGLVLFAHGSGSSRLSPRNRFVAGELQSAGIATLLFDLLTVREDEVYENRFDIELLAERLVVATRWATEQPEIGALPVGYFGASTGSAAALKAAAMLSASIRAVVSRGGRPDLAGESLPRVKAATLLIVGGDDYQVIRLNEAAFEKLDTVKRMVIVPGATHLFEEPGTLEAVAEHATAWFKQYLPAA